MFSGGTLLNFGVIIVKTCLRTILKTPTKRMLHKVRKYIFVLTFTKGLAMMISKLYPKRLKSTTFQTVSFFLILIRLLSARIGLYHLYEICLEKIHVSIIFTRNISANNFLPESNF